MKKTIISLILVITLLMPNVAFGVNLPIEVYVNGEQVAFSDVKPFLDSQNRVQVPVRFVTEALGASVSYTTGNKVVVTITLGSKKVVLTVGEKTYSVDGVTKQMDTVPTLVSNRTFVPLRFVSEALGASVQWYNPIVFIDLVEGQYLEKATKSNPIIIWTTNYEIGDIIGNLYFKDHPDMLGCIEIIEIPEYEYYDMLEYALSSGVDAPDLFFVAQDYLARFVENPNVESIDTLAISERELRENQYAYTIDSAKDSSGKVKAVAYTANPGVFVYNTDLAKKYIGSSDPVYVQAAIATWGKFLETARNINKASQGKVKIVAGVEDLYRPFMSNNANSWVDNGALTIGSDRMSYMEYAKIFTDEKLTHDVEQWGQVWNEGMVNDTTLGYFLPTWGVEWVVPSVVDGKSVWAITEGPQNYVWDGSYLAVSKYCDVSGTAADIIRYFALEEKSVKNYTQYTRNFPNNTKVVASMIKDKWRNDTLGNQDYYSVFDNIAKNIKFENHKYDFDISQLFLKCVNDYVSGELSKEEAQNNFKNGVKNKYKDLIVN